MRTKAAFLIGGAVGYVFGTRAGRQQFEKIRDSAQKVWENPKVQETVSDVSQRASGLVSEKAPELKGRLGEAVGRVKGRKDDDEGTTASVSTTTGAGYTTGSATGTTGSLPESNGSTSTDDYRTR